jgi:hypothetical protein
VGVGKDPGYYLAIAEKSLGDAEGRCASAAIDVEMN